jgi:anti-sigma regulatory factor (Ser/Thr protein kinase)
VRRTGKEGQVSIGYRGQLHERRPALPQSIAPLRRAVVSFAAGLGASERQRDDIALAVTEAVSNTVVHAYVGRERPGIVELRARMDERSLEVVVCDEGVGMAPRDDSPGLGIGLPLIVKLTDQFALDSLGPTGGVRVCMTFAIG